MNSPANAVRAALIPLVGLIAVSGRVAAQTVEPLRVLPRLVPDPCRQAATDPDEVVVCGRRDDQDRYRLAPVFRDSSPGREGTSWGAQVREQLERSRFDSQTVGPGGYLQAGRERDYNWRQERRQIQEERRAQERAIARRGND